MNEKEAVNALIAHRVRFMDDFGWDQSTIKALDIAIASLATGSKPVVKGAWIREETVEIRGIWVKWRCDECGYVRTQGWEFTKDGKKPKAKYCESCGADMREEVDDEQVQ